MARNRFAVYSAGVCLIGIFGLRLAQAQTVTGSITGQVTDPSGAVVSGAVVSAENVATSVKTTATTNSAGKGRCRTQDQFHTDGRGAGRSTPHPEYDRLHARCDA